MYGLLARSACATTEKVSRITSDSQFRKVCWRCFEPLLKDLVETGGFKWHLAQSAMSGLTLENKVQLRPFVKKKGMVRKGFVWYYIPVLHCVCAKLNRSAIADESQTETDTEIGTEIDDITIVSEIESDKIETTEESTVTRLRPESMVESLLPSFSSALTQAMSGSPHLLEAIECDNGCVTILLKDCGWFADIAKAKAKTAFKPKPRRDAVETDAEFASYRPLPRGTVAFRVIGQMESVFREKFGCPRQGSLAPSSRGLIRLRSDVVQSVALTGLCHFSDVWLIFLFSQNHEVLEATKRTQVQSQTSSSSVSKMKDGSSSRPLASCSKLDSGRKAATGVGDDVYMPSPSCRSKTHVTAPRMYSAGLRRTGIFASRTPHRPNAIGLTRAKVLKVDSVEGSVLVAGVDLVSGTPLLDIKPVLAGDCAPVTEVPAVYSSETQRPFAVHFTDTALADLSSAMDRLSFYGSSEMEAVRQCIGDVLSLDIRSAHSKKKFCTPPVLNAFEFDNLVVTFSTFVEKRKCVVVRVQHRDSAEWHCLNCDEWLTFAKDLLFVKEPIRWQQCLDLL